MTGVKEDITDKASMASPHHALQYKKKGYKKLLTPCVIVYKKFRRPSRCLADRLSRDLFSQWLHVVVVLASLQESGNTEGEATEGSDTDAAGTVAGGGGGSSGETLWKQCQSSQYLTAAYCCLYRLTSSHIRLGGQPCL